MIYGVYSSDFSKLKVAILIASNTPANQKVYIVDYDSNSRDIASELDVAEYCIYDFADICLKVVDFEQASVELKGEIAFIASPIVDKKTYIIDNENVTTIYLFSKKENYDAFKGFKFITVESIEELKDEKVVSIAMSKSDVRKMSKKNDILAMFEKFEISEWLENDNSSVLQSTSDLVEGKSVDIKGNFLSDIISKILGK